jgi:pyruvate dehydrogenase kinase 2/3/4
MPSIKRVQEWYAQSFEELTTLQKPTLSSEVRSKLMKSARAPNGKDAKILSQNTLNPSVKMGQYEMNGQGIGVEGTPKMSARRYFVPSQDDMNEEWPPDLNAYNRRFAEALEKIKRRHDSVVTTVGKSSHAW